MALFGFELICTVRSTDRNSQRIATCTGSKVNNFFGVSICVVLCRYFILYTSQYAKFAFYCNIELVSILNNLLCQSNIFFIWKM